MKTRSKKVNYKLLAEGNLSTIEDRNSSASAKMDTIDENFDSPEPYDLENINRKKEEFSDNEDMQPGQKMPEPIKISSEADSDSDIMVVSKKKIKSTIKKKNEPKQNHAKQNKQASFKRITKHVFSSDSETERKSTDDYDNSNKASSDELEESKKQLKSHPNEPSTSSANNCKPLTEYTDSSDQEFSNKDAKHTETDNKKESDDDLFSTTEKKTTEEQNIHMKKQCKDNFKSNSVQETSSKKRKKTENDNSSIVSSKKRKRTQNCDSNIISSDMTKKRDSEHDTEKPKKEKKKKRSKKQDSTSDDSSDTNNSSTTDTDDKSNTKNKKRKHRKRSHKKKMIQPIVIQAVMIQAPLIQAMLINMKRKLLRKGNTQDPKHHHLTVQTLHLTPAVQKARKEASSSDDPEKSDSDKHNKKPKHSKKKKHDKSSSNDTSTEESENSSTKKTSYLDSLNTGAKLTCSDLKRKFPHKVHNIIVTKHSGFSGPYKMCTATLLNHKNKLVRVKMPKPVADMDKKTLKKMLHAIKKKKYPTFTVKAVNKKQKPQGKGTYDTYDYKFS
ncbi:Halomucin [Frankliniella fusca]|uniref:Halomucin n=1 Tax=Frankliniella fusca TaxID=407009 RepID=A0AAE1LN97_9NEOP|nr:Halomucin [Frankliniella fusca]